MITEDSSCKISDEEWKIVYKKNLENVIVQCSLRGLLHTMKWLAELNHTLKDVPVCDDNLPVNEPHESEKSCYYMSKCYFDLKEYDRCAYFTENCKTNLLKFLHYYSRYLSSEKKRIEDMTEQTCTLDSTQVSVLNELRIDLAREKSENELDSYCCYLYGVICKKLNLQNEAMEALGEAVRKEPLHWGAWKELAGLFEDSREVDSFDLPHNHFMKDFFLGHLYLKHQMIPAAIEVYFSFRDKGLDSRYVRAQLAVSYHNQRVVDKAILEFAELQALDPCRLENLDTYSNLLYVKEEKVLLSHLAHKACQIDKYRVETCCIIGNLYSLRSEHQKAVVYFQRALRLNPYYLSAWTLMGHEYMELKNSSAAIHSYRQAIEANRRDYRAWYGLGQTYEILRMPSYCLYYYQRAQLLRPNDSRMLVAIGEVFEKLGQNKNACRCYRKARNVGDVEGNALIKMSKLMQKLGNCDHAAVLYKEYVAECEATEQGDKGELSRAYKFLAAYHIRTQELNEAYHFAQKCLGYEETKEEAKNLLREIAAAQKDPLKDVSVPMEEEFDEEYVQVCKGLLFEDSEDEFSNPPFTP